VNLINRSLPSGTTAIAAENANRPWIGIDNSEKYCEMAEKRILNFSQKLQKTP